MAWVAALASSAVPTWASIPAAPAWWAAALAAALASALATGAPPRCCCGSVGALALARAARLEVDGDFVTEPVVLAAGFVGNGSNGADVAAVADGAEGADPVTRVSWLRFTPEAAPVVPAAVAAGGLNWSPRPSSVRRVWERNGFLNLSKSLPFEELMFQKWPCVGQLGVEINNFLSGD